MRFHILIFILMMTLVACRQTIESTAENVTVELALDTENPSVGDATLLVTVTTEDDTAVNDATVNVRADMSHAGMMPVIPDPVTDATDGVYSIPFEFTMGGDWIITVDVTLANGDTASVAYEVDGVASDSDMDIDDMDVSSSVSGAYMTITNNGEEDVTLLSVSVEGAGMVQIHETTVDDNDMASMQEIEDGITITSGETVELAPGGLHIMIMNLETELVDGETVRLTLAFDNDEIISFDAPIMSMAMNDSEVIESGELSISAYWVRPTALADMDDMDINMSEATEEADE